MLNFNFSGNALGIVSPPHFEYDFSRKMFLMILQGIRKVPYSVNVTFNVLLTFDSICCNMKDELN